MREILLATDLDGTLIGDDEALKNLNNLLSELMAANSLKLAYVTGRSLESYNQLAASKSLLTPDALVTAVGTEIYWSGTDLSYGWPKPVDWHRESILSKLGDLHELIKQPETEQRPYKVSFYLKDNPKVLDLVRQRLSGDAVDVLYSHQEYLDILPKGINKGGALNHLASHWKIDNSNIVACGDSANDIDMLTISKAVVVANAHQELLDWVHSDNGPNIYLAKQAYAAGIREGLRNFQSLR